MGSVRAKFSQFASRVRGMMRRKRKKEEEGNIEAGEEGTPKTEELVIENLGEEKEDRRIEIVEMRSRLPKGEPKEESGLSVAEELEVERFVEFVKADKVRERGEELRAVLREEGYNDRVIEEIMKRLEEKNIGKRKKPD